MNKVTAGRFTNKRVSSQKSWLRIHMGWGEYLLLTPEIIWHIQIIDSIAVPGTMSGFLRGAFSGLLPSRSLWLASVLSAKRRSAYTVKITYRDGSASILQLSAKYLAVLASQNRILP